MTGYFKLDGRSIPFQPGQTIIQAAADADVYIPHLCYHPDFTPHGSCKLCSVQVNGRICSACTFPASDGLEVLSETSDLNARRQKITQMLFVEGNHFCPYCEKSGNCQLQAVAYHVKMLDSHFPHFFPQRPLDATHPDVLLDYDRCIFCALCVRASQEADGKNVFALSGRNINKHLIINSESGTLKDSDIAAEDKAVEVCPTGALLRRGQAYKTPIGQRQYDHQDIEQVSLQQEKAHDV